VIIFASLRRIFQQWIAPKLLEKDRDNLHVKFLQHRTQILTVLPGFLQVWENGKKGNCVVKKRSG